MPAKMPRTMVQMFDALTPDMSFGQRIVLANRWLFEPLLTRALLGSASTAASVRTTTAPTMCKPASRRTCSRNSRPRRQLPHPARRHVGGILAHIERTVADPRVKVRRGRAAERAVARIDHRGRGFSDDRADPRQIFPDALVAPGLVLGGTDSRHYETRRRRHLPLPAGPHSQRGRAALPRRRRADFGRGLRRQRSLLSPADAQHSLRLA